MINHPSRSPSICHFFASSHLEPTTDDEVPDIEVLDPDKKLFSINNFSEQVCKLMATVKVVNLFSPVANKCIPFKLDPTNEHSVVGWDFVTSQSKIWVHHDLQNKPTMGHVKVEFKFSQIFAGCIWAEVCKFPGRRRKTAVLGRDFISKYVTGYNSLSHMITVLSDEGVIVDVPYKD